MDKYKLETHNKYSYVQIVTIPINNISKIDLALCNQPAETPDAYYKRQVVKPDIITNGGFFSMSNGETCFSFRDEGIDIVKDSYPGLSISGDKILSYSSSPNSSRDFIAAYPPLIIQGKRSQINYGKELDYKARRTSIGWDKENFYIVTVDSPGLAYNALQNIFLELNVLYAINLDGGGSTRMLIDGKRKTSQSYARPVDNVLCIYLDKEVEKIFYRVQVGAFCLKNNADRLLAELKQKGFSDAYVKKVGLFYKVQLGAFSIKLNAERLQDKLTALGYKSFITTK